jgi:tRNA(fMet)-specific endonuclease VapC
LDKCLLDTDTWSEMTRNVNPSVVAKAATYRGQFDRYTLSTLTVIEVVRGLHKRQREARIQQFLTALASEEVLTLDEVGAEIAGRIDADLERTGQPIGRIDPMIAAIAIANGLTLVTGNTAHYQRIQLLGYALKLEDWRV